MGTGHRLDRRRLIVGGVALASFGLLRPWRAWVDVLDATAAERLADLLPDDDGTERVGSAYLADHPQEADVATLTAELTRSLDARHPELAAEAARVVRAELRSKTIVRIDGWIAAPTEARLAALTTLLRRRRSGDAASATPLR